MMIEAYRRGLPMVLVNARMSERSFLRWQKAGETARALLSSFDLCLAQSLPDAERLARLGAPRALDAGNLKFDVPPPPADPASLALLEGMTGGRVLWVAASTHVGEDEHIITAHKRMAPYLRDLLTIIVPRHPRAVARLPIWRASKACAWRSARSGSSRARRRDLRRRHDWRAGAVLSAEPGGFHGRVADPAWRTEPIEPAKLGARSCMVPMSTTLRRSSPRSMRKVAHGRSTMPRSWRAGPSSAERSCRQSPGDTRCRTGRLPKSRARWIAPCRRSSPCSTAPRSMPVTRLRSMSPNRAPSG